MLFVKPIYMIYNIYKLDICSWKQGMKIMVVDHKGEAENE